MLRLAFVLIVIATLIGALMPSGSGAPLSNERASPAETRLLLVPDAPPEPDVTGTVTLRREPDGHFYADARVNGAPVRFLVDTGASAIALGKSDARRASIPLTPALNQVIGKGASGDVRGEVVQIERVELGHKEARNVTAVVLEGSDQSLLGQSFLQQYASVEIHGDRMILR